jgi:hypothetical protein
VVRFVTRPERVVTIILTRTDINFYLMISHCTGVRYRASSTAGARWYG